LVGKINLGGMKPSAHQGVLLLPIVFRESSLWKFDIYDRAASLWPPKG
jgi:hypothetical protein